MRSYEDYMRYIKLNELDKELKRVDERGQISDDELRKSLSEFCLKIDFNLPDDPFSEEYFQAQMSLYSLVSGKKYSIENEYTEFNFEDRLNSPFPYCTESSTTVGNQLMGIGFLIRTMALPPRSSIIEFGAGWGETTYHLGMMGYNITVVDVGKNFLDLIATKLNKKNISVEVIQNDMLKFKPSKKYDAALFYESFHHCSNPFIFLDNLYDMINDVGIVCFAAEPIEKGFREYLPYPWGIRLDGMSVWSMRKFGWLELGFEQSFFLKMLKRSGFSIVNVFENNVGPYCHVFIARKTIFDIYNPFKRNTSESFNIADSSFSHKNGWYDVENWQGSPTRWIADKAILIINSGKGHRAKLNMKTLSFHQLRVVEVSVNKQIITQIKVPVTFTKITLDINFNRGKNIIQFRVLEGTERPSDFPELHNTDSRHLSIAIQNITFGE